MSSSPPPAPVLLSAAHLAVLSFTRCALHSSLVHLAVCPVQLIFCRVLGWVVFWVLGRWTRRKIMSCPPKKKKKNRNMEIREKRCRVRGWLRHPGSLPGGKDSKGDKVLVGQGGSRDSESKAAMWGCVQWSSGTAFWSAARRANSSRLGTAKTERGCGWAGMVNSQTL